MMRQEGYDTNTRDTAVQALSRIKSHEDQCTMRYKELSDTIGTVFKAIDSTKESVSNLNTRILYMLLLGSGSFIMFLLALCVDVFLRAHDK